MSTWQTQWPEEPGFWWFYGRCFRNEKPKLYMVDIWKGKDYTAYVTEGHFLYREEGAKGFFQKAEVPELPEWAEEE